MSARVVVIGLGTAGITFITEMRRLKANLNCEIILFEKRGAKIFHPCSIPEAIEGKINPENLIEPINLKDIKVIQAEVLEVNPEKKEILFRRDGSVEKMNFDFVFIATGGETPIKKNDNIAGFNKVIKATKYEDVVEIKERLRNGVRKVSIIGAGILGLEIASALSSYADVEVFEMGEQILPKFLKKELAQKLLEYIKRKKSKGLEFHFGQKVENPQSLDSDLVIVCVGFIPNNPLPHKITVDDYMRVKNFQNNGVPYDYIFAAGDCIEDFDVPKVAPIAAEQARVAARNMWAIIQNREPSEKYEKIVAPCLIKAFGFEIGKVAVINKLSETSTFSLDLRVLPFSSDSKIVVSVEVGNDGSVIDVQGFSDLRSEIRHLLDIFYICIKRKIKIDELRRFEFSYQPEVCKFPDPITSIAEFVSRRLNLL